MMKTVKQTFHTIGDHGSDLARTISSDTLGLARRVGSGTAGIAKRIGPRRGLIALAVIAAAIGGSVIVMRLRRRNAALNGASDEPIERANSTRLPGLKSHAAQSAGMAGPH